MITPKGHAKLLDAGLAAFTAGGAIRSTAGSRLGNLPVSALSTVRYLSPEQALGEQIDQRSDLFALGAVLYDVDGSAAVRCGIGGRRGAARAAGDATAGEPHHGECAVRDGHDCRPAAREEPRAAVCVGRALADDLRTVKTVFDAGLEHTIATTPDIPEERSRPTALILAVVVAIVVIALIAWWVF